MGVRLRGFHGFQKQASAASFVQILPRGIKYGLRKVDNRKPKFI